MTGRKPASTSRPPTTFTDYLNRAEKKGAPPEFRHWVGARNYWRVGAPVETAIAAHAKMRIPLVRQRLKQ